MSRAQAMFTLVLFDVAFLALMASMWIGHQESKDRRKGPWL